MCESIVAWWGGVPPGPKVANAGPISRLMNQRLTRGGGGSWGCRRQSAAMGFRGGRGAGAGVPRDEERCVEAEGEEGTGWGEGDREGCEEEGAELREWTAWSETGKTF